MKILSKPLGCAHPPGEGARVSMCPGHVFGSYAEVAQW